MTLNAIIILCPPWCEKMVRSFCTSSDHSPKVLYMHMGTDQGCSQDPRCLFLSALIIAVWQED